MSKAFVKLQSWLRFYPASPSRSAAGRDSTSTPVYTEAIRTLDLQISANQYSYWSSLDGYRCRTALFSHKTRNAFLEQLQQVPLFLMNLPVLLPSLRSITWLSATSNDVYALMGFLCPSVELLEFRYGLEILEMHGEPEAMTMAVNDLVHAVLEKSPLIQSFSLFFNSLYPEPLPALGDVIEGLTELTVFRTDAHLLSRLANRPSLNSVDLRPATASVAPEFDIPPAPFSVIRALRSTLSIPSTVRLADFVSARLEHFAFRFQGPTFSSHHAYTLLIHISSCSNLSSLAISIWQRGPERHADLSWHAVFHPTLCCRQLRQFMLDADTPISLELFDRDVENFARAWPQLQSLVIDCLSTYITLDSIASLAVHCPDLRSVQLPALLAHSIPPSSHPTPRPRVQVNLQITVFQLLDPVGVLEFILAFWPLLQVEVIGHHSYPCQKFLQLVQDRTS